MAFLAEHGFPPREFRQPALGPVMRKDELEYFREVQRGRRALRRSAPAGQPPGSAGNLVTGDGVSSPHGGCRRRRDAFEMIAKFREPAGIIIGLYQERGRAASAGMDR